MVWTIINRLLGWVGIAIYAALVYEMLRLWISPQANEVDRIATLAVMMAFEFIMVHSGVFMAALPRKFTIFFFVPFYGIFALIFNSLAPGNEILYLYMGVVFMRMRFAFSDADEATKAASVIMSILAVFIYFVLVFIFAFGAALVPRLGLTEAFLEMAGYANAHNSGGIFIDYPHVPLAMGTVYFTLLAMSEVWVFKLFSTKLPARGEINSGTGSSRH
ncbi:hypothetical protein ACJ3XI_07440 [Litorimonas sp. RW-G-Af-16]|uniref:hypothetical protein n=1 Tax=Litorimonas sp. RW-G-Af-16 TaxID=3241168 RepID=UPI00390CD370